ncbi:MAG: EAL domain-containing protein, partial [Deltaproteobacteria bacterium]|nr:EAL domain-containing protein [Deltaproteobacteria bacterium]
MDFVPVENRPETEIMVNMVLRGKTFSGIETRRLTKDGRQIEVSISGAVYLDNQGQVQGSVITLQDITQRKLNEEKLRYIAYHDTLTGLPNRKSFYERLEDNLLQTSRSGKNRLWALLFLDLDRFKNINDSLGHDVGDLLLKEAAERIMGCLRKTDHVFRLGGDEFTVILTRLSKDIDAARVAQKLLKAIAEPFHIRGLELFVTASLGISVYPTDGQVVETLVRNADTAMYAAKKEANQYRFFTEEMNQKALKRMQLETSLRSAAAQNELFLHYQPLVNGSQKIIGVEALVRWQHPELGLIPPEEFIPIAEETGLIFSLGRWILKKACLQAKRWQEAGFDHFFLAINLSPRQFRHQDLVQTVADVLAETGLEAERLKLEVTESSVMESPEEAIAKMNKLSALGVSFSIDNFGTGYSLLNYLKRFPVDTLKIDSSFVRDAAQNSDYDEVIKTIIAMAGNLKMETLAEGVETEEQEE